MRENETRKMLIWGVETQKDTKQEGSTFVHTYYTITYCTIFSLKGRTQRHYAVKTLNFSSDEYLTANCQVYSNVT